MNKKTKKWYKLDNAAKIFPPTSTKKDPKVFRISCELYEDIDEKILQEAIEETIEEYPMFLSSLKKGLFWYYLETSSVTPKVEQEKNLICDYMDASLLFRVSYYKKRINLEMHHALTDGTGTIFFIKSLVTNYLKNKYCIKDKILVDNASIFEKESDSFEKYYKKMRKLEIPKSKRAYNLKGDRYPEERLKIIEGVLSCDKVLASSKSYNTTVTIYLVSVLIKSISSNMSRREKRKPIVITVPVNLRKYFKSNTARNFFSTINISYKSKNDNEKLEDIISSVSRQFQENISKEKLDRQMNDLALLENLFIIRIVPLFIKNLVLKYFHLRSKKNQTMTLSNIGIIEMPKELQKYIKLFDVMASTDKTQLCMCSYLNKMVLTFTTHLVDTEIEKNFFKELNIGDTEIIINSNVVEDSYEEVL